MCGAEVGCSNIAFPKLVIELMPSGEKAALKKKSSKMSFLQVSDASAARVCMHRLTWTYDSSDDGRSDVIADLHL